MAVHQSGTARMIVTADPTAILTGGLVGLLGVVLVLLALTAASVR